MKILALLALAVLVILAAGCAGTPNISPDQLATVTKENRAAVGCGAGTGLYGRGNVVFVNAEHASVASGKLTVSADCTVTIEANQPVPK